MDERYRTRTAARVARRIGRLALLAPALPLLAGCYNYTPIPVASAPVGEKVRLVVNRSGVPEVVSVMETELAAPQIRGVVEGSDNGTLLLRMSMRPEGATSPSVTEISQMVRVPLDEVLSAELQSFSGKKTAFFVAGTAAAAGFVVFTIIDASRGSTKRDDPNPDVLFSLRIPIG